MDYTLRLYFDDEICTLHPGEMECQVFQNRTVYTSRLRHCEITWTLTAFDWGTQVDFQAKSPKPLGLNRVDSLVLPLPVPEESHRILFLGNTSNIFSAEPLYPAELGVMREYSNDIAGVYKNLSEPGVLLGAVAPFANLCGAGVQKQDDGSLLLFGKTEFTPALAQSTCLQADTLLFCPHIPISSFLQLYHQRLPQSSFPMPKLTGWNSWDYYLNRVTAQDVLENVQALKQMSFAHYLNYIVIDDGWQKSWGDWRENEKFACGLSSVADSIRGAGFTPGIWMAPLCVESGHRHLETHPHWFLRRDDGSLFSEYGYYFMDPSHPEVEAFILENYRYLYNAGYRLFKIDYLGNIRGVRNFYEKQFSAYEILARLIRRIVEATGPDVVILGCSLPLQCGADIAPSMRIGVDIHNHFSHVEWIAEYLTWACVYNGRVTRIDPDFLVVRGEETSHEPLLWEGERNDYVLTDRTAATSAEIFRSRWRNGDQFSLVEAETWANLVSISGGNLFLSDKMTALNEQGLQLIHNAFEMQSETVRPCFLPEDSRRASLWLGDRSLLLINWTQQARTFCVPVSCRNLQSHKEFSLKDGMLCVTLQPHESFMAHIEQ